MMNILALINISNVDDPICDSGVVFQSIISRKFRKAGHTYTVLGPNIPEVEALISSTATYISCDLGASRYGSRYSFPFEKITETIRRIQPNFFFNQQAELSPAIRAAIASARGLDTKLLTYCHYPALYPQSEGPPIIDPSLNAFGLGSSIVLNILSGLLLSDVFFTQSRFAAELLYGAAKSFNIKIEKDIRILPPMLDPMIFRIGDPTPPPRRTLVYNHRLYQSYGTDEFLSYIDMIHDLDVDVLVADPMPRRSSSRALFNDSPTLYRTLIREKPRTRILNGGTSREAYRDILLEARVGLAAPRKACVWSMSSIDCLSLGIPVLAPSYGAYPEFIPSDLLFTTWEEAKQKLGMLMNDDVHWLEKSKESQEMANKFSIAQFYKTFCSFLKDLG